MAPVPRRAVCTTLIGGYEDLTEQPVAPCSDMAFVCLTDDPDLRSETWDVRLVETALPRDPVRSARRIKLLLHEYLPEFPETLWIDNSIRLLRPPDAVVAAALDGADLTVMTHSFRASVLDEFRAVVEQQLDDPARVEEQLAHYLDLDPQVLDEQPFACGLMVRRSTPDVVRLMTTWWEHVLRYSRRDQLSFNWAAARCGMVPGRLDLQNEASDLHVGNAASGRRAERRVEGSVVRASEYEAVVRAADSVAAERDGLRVEVASLRPAVAERDEMLATRTWRWSAPVRRIWAAARRVQGPRSGRRGATGRWPPSG